ncbi:MAG: GntR family transcriptional regulator [Xanthobacteraceae bacterium]
MQKKRASTGAQRVYAALRHAIIALEIEPGTPLEEERLCKEYKVSRTPMREALIRLASDGLVELEANKGARVAALQLVDVIDHYEAMDVFQPAIWHFATVRRNDADILTIKKAVEAFKGAIVRKDAEAIVRSNYEAHRAIAAASHNRSHEKAYQQMLVDKLRVAQHAAHDLTRDRGHILATRFSGALRILEQLVDVIVRGDAKGAQSLARDYNTHVREQIVAILSASLGNEIVLVLPDGRNGRGGSSRTTSSLRRTGSKAKGVTG